MRNNRFLFASIDSPPIVGGVSHLAKSLSISLAKNHSSEAVYLGPKGTAFHREDRSCKVYEDFQSEKKLRAGPYAVAEDLRIRDLGQSIINAYNLDAVILWHAFYYGNGITQAARMNSVPVAVFVHGTEMTSQFPDAISGRTKFIPEPESNDLQNRLYRTLLSADFLLTNSTFSAKVANNICPSKPITVVGCGLDTDVYEREACIQPQYSSLTKRLAREALGLPDLKTFIHISRLVPHKNQRQSITLTKNIPHSQLILVGDGPERENLEKYAAELEVSDRVFFVGQVTDIEKWAYLRASDVGLLLSLFDEQTGGYEGFGIAMLEYTAAACAVITNGNHGMIDYVEPYGCAIKALEDPNDFEADIKRLSKTLEDESWLIDHIDKARKVCLSKFTWGNIAERVSKAFENV